MNDSRKNNGKILGMLLSIVLLVALIYFTDKRELVDAINNLSYPLILILILVSGLLILVSVMKWRLFIRAFGGDQKLGTLYELYLIGYFINSFLPSYVGGDVVRGLEVGKKIGKTNGITSTILERYTGLVAMIILATSSLFLTQGTPLSIRWAILFLAIGLIVGTSAVLSKRFLKVISSIKIFSKILPQLKKVQEGLRFGLLKRSLISESLIFSFIFHTLTVLNTWICAQAVGWYTVSWQDLFVVLPLILLIGGIPITPANLGVQEGAFYFFLKGIGATDGQALLIALILRAKTYFLGIVGGLVFLKNRASSALTKN